MDGVLVIDKPEGPTSHDVVVRLRRVTGVTRVGHTGTLDPLASGVLPLVFGRAARLAQFLMNADKEYEAQIRLGLETDTYDISGQPITVGSRGPEAMRKGGDSRATATVAGSPSPHAACRAPGRASRSAQPVGQQEIQRVLSEFCGSYLQHPPPFSAKKIDGTRAYALARRGAAVQPAASPVVVSRLEILDLQHDLLRLRLTSSAGFYVRSLAHDLGRRLGTGACLQTLRRLRSGDFGLDRAIPLDVVERDADVAFASLVPISNLLTSLPGVVLTADGARRAARGHLVGPAHVAGSRPDSATRVRLLDEQGHLIAIAEPTSEPGVLHPGVVVV